MCAYKSGSLGLRMKPLAVCSKILEKMIYVVFDTVAGSQKTKIIVTVKRKSYKSKHNFMYMVLFVCICVFIKYFQKSTMF